MKTYGRYAVSHDETKVGILEIAPHVAIRFKALFPQVKKANITPIMLSLSYKIAEDLEWFLSRYPMESDPKSKKIVKKVASNSRKKTARIEQILGGYETTGEIKLNGIELREYQTTAVRGFLESTRMLCGDDVGLGKTFIGLGALTDPRARPALIVVQTHLVRQWTDRVVKHLGLVTREIKTTNPNKEVLQPADVYITNYHRLSGWVDPLSSGIIKSVIFDEVQELRRSESQRYTAAYNIASKSEYVLGLSATPVYNFGVEMYNIMDCISPHSLGTREEFLREWCKDDWQGKVGNPKALGTFLRDNHLFLRRTRKEVERELPPVNKIVHTVPYDEKEQDKALELAMALAKKTVYGSFTERGQAAREFDLMLRMATGVAKAPFVAEYVKILLENGEKVLLAGWHRDVYDIWLRELAEYKPVMYTGSESPTQKEESKRKILAGESSLMIISLRSGVGLDGLQDVCTTVVLGELDWSPQVHEQLIGRVDRDGQTKQVTAIFLVSDGGSDPPMVDLLGLKGAQSQGIVDPNSEQKETHSDEGRIKLMAKKYLEQKGVTII